MFEVYFVKNIQVDLHEVKVLRFVVKKDYYYHHISFEHFVILLIILVLSTLEHLEFAFNFINNFNEPQGDNTAIKSHTLFMKNNIYTTTTSIYI